MRSAFAYFFAALVSQIVVCVVELRRVRRPRILWITSAANVAAGSFFIVALIMTRFAPSAPRIQSTLSQWILLAALMTWLVAHSLLVGSAEVKHQNAPLAPNRELQTA